MAYTVELYFNNQWISVDVLTSDSAIYQEVLHKKLRPADNSFKAKLIPTTEILNYLRGVTTTDVPGRIKRDGNTIFQGVLRKSFKISKTQRLEPVAFELVSSTNRLKKKNKTPIFFRDLKVCDPADVNNSLLHQVLLHAGITIDKISINLPTISYVVNLMMVEPDNQTYHEIIADLLSSYGYILDFDSDGMAIVHNLYPDFVPTDNAFTGANCLDKIVQEKREEAADIIEVEWKETRTIPNAVIFSDSTGSNNQNKCNILLPPSAYVGGSNGNDTWYAEFGIDGEEFLAAYDVTIDFIADQDVVLHLFEPYNTKAKISIQNTNNTFERYVRRIDCKGNAIVQKSVNVSRVVNADTDNKERFEARYIFNKGAADYLAQRMAAYYKYSDFTYELQSKQEYPLGAFVVISDTGLGTSNARIIGKQTNIQTGIIQYSLEAVTEFSAFNTEFDHIIPYTPRPREDVDVSDFVTQDDLTNMAGFRVLYTRSIDAPTTPTIPEPDGWYKTIPLGDDTVWMTGANISAAGGLIGNWSTPTQFAGLDAIYSTLSNESHIIPTDLAGENGDYSGATTEIHIYEGGVETTELWLIGAIESPSVTGTLEGSVYTVTSLSERTGFVDITASRSRRRPIMQRFTVSQARDGGTLQPVIKLNVSSPVVQVYPDGTYTPALSDIIIEPVSIVSGEEPVPYPSRFRIIANNIIQYQSSELETRYTWPDIDTSLNPGDGVLPGDETLPVTANPWLGDQDVQVAKIEMWNDDFTKKYDTQSIAFVRDVAYKISDIRNDVYSTLSDYVPRYRGRFLNSTPVEYLPGDWFLIYGEDDTPYIRGVYVVDKDLIVHRITGESSGESSYMVQALPDILWATNNDYGELDTYGAVTFIANLATNSLFAQSLQIGIPQVEGLEGLGSLAWQEAVEVAQLGSTIIEGGTIKTSLLDVDHILGESATFRGSLQAASGTFSGSIESGPLLLNISPPVSSSVSTNGRTVASFIDGLVSSGVAQGDYSCSGMYNGAVVDRISFEKREPYSVATGQTNYSITWGAYAVPAQTITTGSGITVTVGGFYRYFEMITDYEAYVARTSYRLRFYQGSVSRGDISGYVDAPSHWAITGTRTGGTADGPGSTRAAPDVSSISAGSFAPALSNGSISFTSSAFTMKMISLPGYNASLPQWTVYLQADGTGNYNLKIKG